MQIFNFLPLRNLFVIHEALLRPLSSNKSKQSESSSEIIWINFDTFHTSLLWSWTLWVALGWAETSLGRLDKCSHFLLLFRWKNQEQYWQSIDNKDDWKIKYWCSRCDSENLLLLQCNRVNVENSCLIEEWKFDEILWRFSWFHSRFYCWFRYFLRCFYPPLTLLSAKDGSPDISKKF